MEGRIASLVLMIGGMLLIQNNVGISLTFFNILWLVMGYYAVFMAIRQYRKTVLIQKAILIAIDSSVNKQEEKSPAERAS